ncbi:LysE family translocator [Vibrio hangzhouensis]|uniref:Resistance to homoserine/threonine (RhtB) family protein n=1 Tax=Vibrio hangzhouensis TaxID=462991 RepID=A0A1H5VGI9_9VIBR|nr:LysE family transporter [Vibrio hangzhouensis]SEF86439.1 resistance to homoserine/threonine (RhtB) family protein [Vibrio hangzhouensis]
MELLLTQYLSELLAVITITILTIVTPGPDFIVVVRNSLVYSARSGIYTALGVASAVWIHIGYTLAGIGILLSKSILLFSIVKYLGAFYLFYLGYCCIKSKGSDIDLPNTDQRDRISALKSFQMGFLNNALNPKATLFFVSLFTQLVSTSTPLEIQITYGAIVSLTCLIWFSLVALFLNRTYIRKAFLSIQAYVEKTMGVVLVAFGIKVALSSTN